MANDALKSNPASEPSPSHPHPPDSRWQRRLLPFLVGTLGLLTLLFCAAIAWETHYIQSRMESAPEIDLRPAVTQEFRADASFLLEANLIERRYRAANAAALSRIYIMFLGFGTGMVMALVGATFILGKISEPATSIDGAGSSFKASLHSGSPGVILAFLGTVLMLSTIFSKTEISVSDRAVYIGAAAGQPPQASEASAPGKSPAGPQPAGVQESFQEPQAASNNTQRPDVHITMTSHKTLDGDYTLSVHKEPCTLSVHDRVVQFTASGGRKWPSRLIAIDQNHLHFSVTEPAGGQNDFDGFLDPQGNIVGSTSYQGGFSTGPTGFTAVRIK